MPERGPATTPASSLVTARPLPAPALFFVLWKDDSGEQKVVGEYGQKHEARSHYETLIRLGWPKTHTASIYRADSRLQVEEHLAERVRLVCAGIGAGYWESAEGQEQRRLRDEQEACPSCSREYGSCDDPERCRYAGT